MAAAALGFPVVAKPDVGWQGCGVCRIGSAAELRDHLARFPRGELVILQRSVDGDGEGGVYYARLPGEPAGPVIGLGLRFQSLLFEIAARNRARGCRPMPLARYLRWTWRYDRILAAYPPCG